MNKDVVIVTNNPLVLKEMEHRYSIIYKETTFDGILEQIRDLIHKGYRLLTHPLSGSVKPGETPYKSVLMSRGETVSYTHLDVYKRQGLGKPIPPTVTGILGNLARIPMAVMLSATVLGLDGVWWSITISSCAKGIVVFTWFVIILRRFLAKAREENDEGNVEKESLKVVRVVAAVIRREDRIFATAKGYGEFKGQWEFPGGKIETGESPKQALAREIREELDVEIQVGDLIETIEYDYPTFHLSMDCFWAEIISGEIVLKEAEKAKWLTKETIDSVNWLPADITLVNKLKEYLSDSKGKYE